MTITQKKHRKESCRAKLFTLQNKAKKENRELTSEEEQELTAILEEIEKIDEEIASKRDELLALNDKKEEYNSAKREFDEKLEDKPIEEDGNRKGERFSLTRAIRAIANNEGLRDAELRAVERGKRA
jgi:oligoendopeptidase F